jgi:hypothetical protein
MEFIIQVASWLTTPVDTSKPCALNKIERGWGWNHQRPLSVMSSGGGDDTLKTAALKGMFWEPQDTLDISVAVKSDTATLDASLWDIGGPEASAARDVLRRFLHGAWYRRLRREAHLWLEELASRATTEEEIRDLEWSKRAIVDCLVRARFSDWFEWSAGSRLFFWRWPKEWQLEARDGMPIWQFYTPAYRPTARVVRCEQWMQDMVNDKLRKFVARRYIKVVDRRHVKVAIVYFAVKKGESDI